MMHFKSDLGEITVSNAVFSNIAGMAATNCYGVKGMAFRSMTDGLVHLLRREAMSKGISVTYHEDKPAVVAAIAEKTATGIYPDDLWAQN